MRVLVVEDDARFRGLLRRALQAEGYAVDLAADGEEGLELLGLAPYDLAIVDVMLPRCSGIELCRRLRERRKHRGHAGLDLVARLVVLAALEDVRRPRVGQVGHYEADRDRIVDCLLLRFLGLDFLVQRLKGRPRLGVDVGEEVIAN